MLSKVKESKVIIAIDTRKISECFLVESLDKSILDGNLFTLGKIKSRVPALSIDLLLEHIFKFSLNEVHKHVMTPSVSRLDHWLRTYYPHHAHNIGEIECLAYAIRLNLNAYVNMYYPKVRFDYARICAYSKTVVFYEVN